MFATIRSRSLVLAALLSVTAACSSTGGDRPDTTASNMERLRDSVTSLQTNLNAASKSLDELVSKASEDPRPSFASVDSNVAAVESSYQRIESQVQSAQAEAQAYFAEWAKKNETITDADVKKAAEERRDKLTKHFEPV